MNATAPTYQDNNGQRDYPFSTAGTLFSKENKVEESSGKKFSQNSFHFKVWFPLCALYLKDVLMKT